MKSNICIACVSNEYAKLIAKLLSDKLDMYFADVSELIQFDLIDINAAQQTCGPDYIKKIERGKIKYVCSFDNTCISVDYAMLNDSNNISAVLEKCVLVCLNISKAKYKSMQQNTALKMAENKLNNEMFDTRTKLLLANADVAVKVSVKDGHIVDKIIKKLNEYYKK